MAEPLDELLAGLKERAEFDLFPSLLRAASLRTEAVRIVLAHAGLRYAGDAGPPLTEDDLDHATTVVLAMAAQRGRARSRLGALLGPIGLPGELVGDALGLLHLAQRLAVLYGFTLEDDLGRLVVLRLVLRALGLPVPEQGRLELRASELVAGLRGQPNPSANQSHTQSHTHPSPAADSDAQSRTTSVPTDLVRQTKDRAIESLKNRLRRYIPILGNAARDADTKHAERAARMVEELRRLEGLAPTGPGPTEAVVVSG